MRCGSAGILRSCGFRFTAFFAGPPDAAVLSRLRALPGKLDTLEMISPLKAINAAFDTIADANGSNATRLQLTPLLPPDAGQQERAGKQTIRCGFYSSEDATLRALAPFPRRGLVLASRIARPLKHWTPPPSTG